ncbi:MAG TPA: hypothetical protein VMT27_05275 [Actinomycetes bacterium]|nr:hypothetical protein [Actinomycetes bacterium]
MRRAREPRCSRRERAAEKLRYWYQATPAGIQDDWSAATSGAVIPEAALERFRTGHPEVSAKGAHRVEQALLQWVRVEGRSPGAHELPSFAVEELWRSLRRDEGDWEVFCDSLGIELDAGLDELTHWVPDDDSEPIRATWSEAFDDEVPLTGYPTLFIVDGEVGIADPIVDLPDPDATPSPDTFDIYEPAKTDPGPVSGPPAWDADPPPAGVEAVVDRLAPPLPSLRSDGIGAVLRERRERRRRSLLDGWWVLTQNTTMPSGLAARFTEHFPEVDAGSVALIWDAFMQWLRIEGRKYPTRHAMPARSVDALLSMLRSDPRAWNDVREGWPVSLDYLFGHPRGVWSPGDDLEPLVATWSDAFCDEPPKSRTPLLFRVDAAVGIRNGCDCTGYCGSGPEDGSGDPGMGIFLG